MSERQPLSEWMQSVEMTLPPSILVRPASVYRAFDTQGNQLYIGVAADLRRRWSCHRSQTEWAKSARLLVVHEYEWRSDALRQEMYLIKTTHPIHNKKRDGWLRCGHVKPTRTRGAALDGSTFWWVFRSSRGEHGQG